MNTHSVGSLWAAKRAKTSKSDRRSRNDSVDLEFDIVGLELNTVGLEIYTVGLKHRP